MTKIVFRTNIDEAQHYLQQLDGYDSSFIPQKGMRFEFSSYHRKNAVFELEVCSVTYKTSNKTYVIELHVPSYYGELSMLQWIEWFNKHIKGV